MKSDHIREKYGIKKDVKIVLHLGGIQEYFSCVELALTFANMDGYVLLFHGHAFGGYIDKLRETIERNNIKNVIVSEEVYDSLDDMDPLIMSCDVGVAWYNDVSVNFTTAGKSSGKISAYMRFGLPTLAKRYKSTVDAIERKSCGVCVDDFSEIPAAMNKIKENHTIYSENALREYDEIYWFENYRQGLLDYLRDIN